MEALGIGDGCSWCEGGGWAGHEQQDVHALRVPKKEGECTPWLLYFARWARASVPTVVASSVGGTRRHS